MRPLMATFMDSAVGDAALGSYDENLAITLDRAGHPLAETAGGESRTFVVAEPADDERAWSGVETLTKVVSEPADDVRVWSAEVTLTAAPKEESDDDRPWALETLTRVVNEPADDERTWAAGPDPALPPADDLAIGLVSF
jgi:hypothetical protein